MDFLNPAANPVGFTIFIFVIIGLSFVWRAKWSSGLLTGGMQGGTPGTAVITGMGQTGTMINNLPVMTFDLAVSVNGQAPYAASIRQTIPHMAFGMLAPGRTVAVVVSPKNPSKVKIDIQGTANVSQIAAMPGMTPAMGAGMGMGMPAAPGQVPMPPVGGGAMAPGMPGMAPAGQTTSNAELLARGTRTWVTIMTIQDTGQLYNGMDPVLVLGLHVHAADGEYQTSSNAYRVPINVRQRIQVGKQLQGAFDPANRMSVALDWETA